MLDVDPLRALRALWAKENPTNVDFINAITIWAMYRDKILAQIAHERVTGNNNT